MDSILLSSCARSPQRGNCSLLQERRWTQQGPEARFQQQERRDPGPDAVECWSPEDTSYPGRTVRYTSFVLSVSLAMTSALLVTPAVLFMEQKDACQTGCFSLDDDLRKSINHSVHPCEDFYRHVCSGWDGNELRHHLAPLDKYNIAFSRRIVKNMLLGNIPMRSTKAKGKAAGFIFRCLSQGDSQSGETLRAFLLDLGLPWPSMSSATRQQLLDILVRASLQFGMPMFWSFTVGRHPYRPSENTIYMMLEQRFIEWMHDVSALSAKGKESDYFRRCAEIVGKSGQSYSRMIEHVLNTHFDIADLVHVFWGEFNVPRFHNLSDPDLRRAVNGYLPDESQLWPADEIVNLQPELFDKLNATHLSQDGWRERFKLFLGAYIVWALSPMVSPYLTTSLLEDIGRVGSESNHRFFKCFQALEMVLPLVKWQLHREAMKRRMSMWKVLRLTKEVTRITLEHYGEDVVKRVHGLTARLAANAFNMTSTWEMLDNAYAYLPNDSHTSFFNLYKRSNIETAAFFKRSLRRPHHNVFHVPVLASTRLYRLLVGREVTINSYLASSPLYEPEDPVPVLTSLAGTVVSGQLVTLLRFGLFYDSQFRHYRSALKDPGLKRLSVDVSHFEGIVNGSGLLPHGSRHEYREVYMASMAAHIASRMQDMSEWRTQLADDERPAPSRGKRKTFPWVPPEQLFFYLFCFSQCGSSGRVLQLKVAVCNVAIPASPRFLKAFRCGPQHKLYAKFSWPEPTKPNDDAPFRA